VTVDYTRQKNHLLAPGTIKKDAPSAFLIVPMDGTSPRLKFFRQKTLPGHRLMIFCAQKIYSGVQFHTQAKSFACSQHKIKTP